MVRCTSVLHLPSGCPRDSSPRLHLQVPRARVRVIIHPIHVPRSANESRAGYVRAFFQVLPSMCSPVPSPRYRVYRRGRESRGPRLPSGILQRSRGESPSRRRFSSHERTSPLRISACYPSFSSRRGACVPSDFCSSLRAMLSSRKPSFSPILRSLDLRG